MNAFAQALVDTRTARRRSRVAIVHNHPIHYKELLFRALAERDLDFTVLFTARSSKERLDPKQIERPYKHCFGSEGHYEDVSASRTVRFVWKTLQDLQPDTVIISGYYDAAAWAAWSWAMVRGRTRILWAESNHFDYARHWWKELPKKIFVKGCYLAHVYGTSNREYIEKLGMPRERIHIKRAVLDVAQFHPPPPGTQKSGPKTLLFVGRYEEQKNLHRLIRAFCRVSQSGEDPRMRLALVGYGSLDDELTRLASSLPNGHLVEFRGPKANADTVQDYRAADLFILPSTREAWGLVALEAMCCGLPVLISNRCGCARDLVTEATGWSFDPFNDDDLTTLLNQASWLDRDRLREMGVAARDIGASYSASSCAAIIQKTIEAGRP